MKDGEASDDLHDERSGEGTTRELAGRLRHLAHRLPSSGSPDRSAADLAEIAAELAERLAVLEERAGGIEPEGTEASSRRSAGAGELTGGVRVPDDYYWTFEDRMRGSPESISSRLGIYEDLARAHLGTFVDEDERERRWLDLGCGRGEFCGLLRGWGWDVEGVDASPSAIETCRAAGFHATRADALEHLRSTPASRFAAVSAIQLIEHLPPDGWLTLFGEAYRVLRPGGGLLVETINPTNPDAIGDHFYADVTHTWPAHPETLRLMAEHVGFVDVRVRFEHQDHRGAAQDVAMWARRALLDSPEPR